MNEILPGIFHWTAFNPNIGENVYSCFLKATEPRVVIDPMIPEQGLSWFRKNGTPEHVYLTNRLHYRDAKRFIEAFGCKVWCHEAGLREFSKGQKVIGFEHGTRLPGGIRALKIGVLCPEETALFIPLSGGAIAIGDALLRVGNQLRFMPDELLGDDHESVKRGLRLSFRRLLRRDFNHLFFAHGKPWIGGAKNKLREFV